MTEHEHENSLDHPHVVEDDYPNVKLNSTYLVSQDNTKTQDGVETTEQLLALEIQFMKSLPGQWVMHLKMEEKDKTPKPKILESAVFEISDNNKSKKSYDRLSDKPKIDESSPHVTFQLDSLDKSRLCLAILFRASHLPTFDLLFSRQGTEGDLVGVVVSGLHHLAPSKPTSDQTPFSWALACRWFDAFVGSDDETVLLWAAANGSLELMEHLKTHSADRFQDLLEHRDKEGRTPLSLAVRPDREIIVTFLLDAGADIRSEDNQKMTPLSWALSQLDPGYRLSSLRDMMRHYEISDDQPRLGKQKLLFQSARFGWVKAVIALILWETEFDTVIPDEALHSEHEAVYQGKTALCMAAEHGHRDVVTILLDFGANVNFSTSNSECTPLMLAISGDVNEYLKAAVADVLITGGAEISRVNKAGHTAEHLAMNQGLQSVLNRLTWRSNDGTAAESVEQLNREVDDLFLATVTTFETEGDCLKRFMSKKHPIHNLLRKLDKAKEVQDITDVAFEWIHLPANNMRWIEVLISQLYKEKTQTYNILKPERWVRRQHHRGLDTSDATPDKPGVHHARFMRPICQAFPSSKDLRNKSKSLKIEKDQYDTNMVVFMPYLHWDITKNHTEREKVMKQTTHSTETNNEWSHDQKFLNAYLFYNKDSQNEPDPKHPSLERHYMHQPHVRRTLDQYYYHDLESTRERDRDQVLSRSACQKHLPAESKVLAMVDQLWLWVLAGKSGQPTTIVTCFPHKEAQSNDTSGGDTNKVADNAIDPDPSGETNIVKQVLSHMLDNPQSVITPHDLAKLITLKCSRTYLDIGGQDERLRFKEMYEMAIGDVMQKETELFNEFTAVMEATKKEGKTNESLEQLKTLSEAAISETVEPEKAKQSQADLIKKFETVFEELNNKSANQFVTSLFKSSRGRITQAKAETLLKLAQFQVLDITKEVQLLHEIKDVQDELRIMSMIFRDQKVIIDEMEEIIGAIPLKGAKRDSSVSQHQVTGDPIVNEHSDDSETATRAREKTPADGFDEKTDERRDPPFQERNSIHVGSDAFFTSTNGADSGLRGPTDYYIGNRAFFTSTRPEPGKASTSLDEKQRSVLSTRAVVKLSIDEIEDMIDGANNAYSAKQSNVMDARYARVQAEQSARQGKTIMVFTIVTIVFLPLSFMAAFFAIDISQFKRLKNGRLSLGYVSEIMFPISAFIIASLIYVAFKIDDFEWLWTINVPKWKRKKVVADLEKNQPSKAQEPEHQSSG
ncbi:hypothetical protein FG05_09117 [Fusarium graminearum]|nr:hypothetical protein FG05_09117 [Fusarium graminearum]